MTASLLISSTSYAIDTFPGPLPAEVLRVINGDTIFVEARPWPGLRPTETKVQTAGVDTPNISGKCHEERMLAREARRFVETALGFGEVRLFDVRHGIYASRMVDRVEVDGEDLALRLIKAGLGRPYDGGKRPEWCS